MKLFLKRIWRKLCSFFHETKRKVYLWPKFRPGMYVQHSTKYLTIIYRVHSIRKSQYGGLFYVLDRVKVVKNLYHLPTLDTRYDPYCDEFDKTATKVDYEPEGKVFSAS